MDSWLLPEFFSTLERPQTTQTNKDNDLGFSASNPSSLVCSSNISNLTFGTGHSIYRSTILPAIAEARSEVVIVTCFWAKSATLVDLSSTLEELSAKALKANIIITVRICFSSRSMLPTLLYALYSSERVYTREEWTSVLGLPPCQRLPGLDLEVRSRFVLPFGVMHSKFVIVDRSKIFLPSCNVSWEDWFEGCVEFTGSITGHFVQLWKCFWASEEDRSRTIEPPLTVLNAAATVQNPPGNGVEIVDLDNVRSVFLPSPHHRDPCLSLPWLQHRVAPPTPLNVFLQTLFSQAQKEILIQTPNLTSHPVLEALIAALDRGINVSIVTSERLMVLEQLVTARTTTKRCVDMLIRRRHSMAKQQDAARPDDLEAGLTTKRIGRLCIEFYHPRANPVEGASEPVQSHLKLTMVDDRVAVLGSGNMDRASWYTSQELGVAFASTEFVAICKQRLRDAMAGRSSIVYDSAVTS